MTWTPVYDQSSVVTGSNRSALNGYTLRTKLPTALFSAAAGTQCRVTFRFGTSSAVVSAGISEVWGGQAGASNGDFTGDQVQLKFGGLNTMDSSADGIVVSDAFTLAQTWDATKQFILSYAIASGASASLSVQHVAVTGTDVYYNPGSSAGVTSFTFSGHDPGFDDFVTKIEINVITGPVFLLGDRVLDLGLNVLDTEADIIHVCATGAIAAYSDVTSLTLGNKNFGAGAAFGSPAADSAGRKVTSAAISNGSITTAGTVAQWAAVDSANSRLLACGPLSGGVAVTPGQSFSLDAIPIQLKR